MKGGKGGTPHSGCDVRRSIRNADVVSRERRKERAKNCEDGEERGGGESDPTRKRDSLASMRDKNMAELCQGKEDRDPARKWKKECPQKWLVA